MDGSPKHEPGRFALDIRQLCLGHSGDRSHLLGLLSEFSSLAPEDEFLLCLNEPCPDGPAGLPEAPSYRLHALPCRPGWLWTPLAWPRLLRRERVQVAHGVYLVPPFAPCPTVVTIHDVSFLAHPEWFPKRELRIMRLLIPLSARRATRIVTASDHAASETASRLGVSRDKIVVIPYAADPCFAPMDPDQVRRLVGATYGLQGRYVLVVGLLQPRKNLVRLLDAFALMAQECPDVRLAVVGAGGWGNEPLHERLRALQLGERVALLGSVPLDHLRALYCGAQMLVYPSLYEGFGLPPLEAMCCGTPVVASNATSIPEVVGDAALLVDPLEPRDMAAAMKRVLDDGELAAELVRTGFERAATFSWRKAAQAYLDLFRSLARGAAHG